MKSFLFTLFVLAWTPFHSSVAYPLTPNSSVTPGHLCTTHDSDFYEYRYSENIPYCKRSVSTRRKKVIYKNYGIPKHCQHRYTIDHMIPLAIGGSNTNKNLWPEHVHVKATRPNLEISLYWDLRRGDLTQAEAIAIVLHEKNNLAHTLKNHDFKNSGCDIPQPNN